MNLLTTKYISRKHSKGITKGKTYRVNIFPDTISRESLFANGGTDAQWTISIPKTYSKPIPYSNPNPYPKPNPSLIPKFNKNLLS